MAGELVSGGLRYRTHVAYNSAQKYYLKFCQLYQLQPIPAAEQQLLRFVAYAHLKGLQPSTIKVYLSAVSSLHTLNGLQAPPTSAYRVKLAIKALADIGPAPSKCSPITYHLLGYIISTLRGYDLILYKAMLCLGFFGALRGAEYSASMAQNGTLSALCQSHIQFVTTDGIQGLVLTLPKTKTTSKPIHVTIGCSGTDICAVCSMLQYLQLRHQLTGLHPAAYLFTHQDGRPVFRDRLNAVIKQAVTRLGLPAAGFSTHSLRAGAATTASQVGFSDHEIKMLGHWASTAFTAYVHQTHSTTLLYAKRLTKEPL